MFLSVNFASQSNLSQNPEVCDTLISFVSSIANFKADFIDEIIIPGYFSNVEQQLLLRIVLCSNKEVKKLFLLWLVGHAVQYLKVLNNNSLNVAQ